MSNQLNSVLFDLDNTLYNYDSCNQVGLKSIFDNLSKVISIAEDDFFELYDSSRIEVKLHIPYQASSHSRLLYIKILLEKISTPVDPRLIISLEENYWSAFLEEMDLFEGVADCLEYLQAKKIKIGLVTDLNLRIQLKKLIKLDIHKYFNKIITSEEVGIEKPSPKIFNYALNSLKTTASETCMVGDSLDRDIKGAAKLGIYTIFKNSENKIISEANKTFNDFIQLRSIFNEII